MARQLYKYLADDHDRLEGLFQRAAAKPGAIDMEAYHKFRKGLLRHISMEEKIVLPAIARWQGGKKAVVSEQLRLDHAAIVTLLAPPPTESILLTIHSILKAHNALEEEAGGLYEMLADLAGVESEEVLARLQAAPQVSVLPNNCKAEVLAEAEKAVLRAGRKFIVAQ